MESPEKTNTVDPHQIPLEASIMQAVKKSLVLKSVIINSLSFLPEEGSGKPADRDISCLVYSLNQELKESPILPNSTVVAQKIKKNNGDIVTITMCPSP